ncbi:MAG TPA: deoxyguanosinetriphosphate triphosphohydrolase [Papillibacter sp.]|nr:deoxyguanosinetriphosphate triphosphohydrolase [Papillibacter sp.]HHT16163.1 deoxyguanosinetriphosphate triphosphohydrolase [Papillibacter sp.]
MTIREKREALEEILAPRGFMASRSRGRVYEEEPCALRTCFQRDIDRIIHSKAFRRLIHKTQVFLQPEGDHYRTRLTHTLEVSRIARTISRALKLNEDLTEAIAMGHDLGHTPFGHAGERALNEILADAGGFSHSDQSLRVVDKIERDGRGLNLTYEVRDGIQNHSSGRDRLTLEAQVVHLADRIAYLNHDLDDALRAGILTEKDIPDEILCVIGETNSSRINTIISDIIENSRDADTVEMSPGMNFAFSSFRLYMFENVYTNMRAKSEERKVYGLISGIYEHYMNNPDKLPPEYRALAEEDGLPRAVADYVSGMTDKYAVSVYNDLFIPAAWQIK